jgi:putative peptide zinc metalloprotease protein
VSLPQLREELALHPGPVLPDGQPSWTLHDPVRNQFFRLDWLTFEILSRWSLGAPDAIAGAVSQATTLTPAGDDVEATAKFLIDNQLAQPAPRSAALFAKHLHEMRGSWTKWLLHHYLFFRIPLVHPDSWLTRWAPRMAIFYTSGFFKLSALALFCGLIFVWRDWERFSATLIDTFTWNGLIGYAFALTGVKAAHELGHAFTAKRYGCRVPTMGIAFLVLWPVAYTDTNEAWKLADQHKRLFVSAAGIVTELVIAIWAMLAWALLPNGSLQSMAFLLATTTWIATLVVNASPFMRFDGYFLLSDWLDMPNLHSRSFALARWDLRERLFALGEEPPEYFSNKRRRWLILFAYATWIYRLTLFLGIAVLVYHFFVKAVGVLLFAVEIVWFIALPLANEMRAWRERWSALKQRRRSWWTAMGALGLLGLTLIPWPTRMSASGILRPAQIYPIHAPDRAQLVTLSIGENAAVAAGSNVLELYSPELELKQRIALARVKRLRWEAASATLDAERRSRLQVLQEELSTAEAELVSATQELQRYAPRAPFAGRLRDLDPDLKPGNWVSRRERLATIVGEGPWQAETYFDEESINRIRIGDTARFYSDGLRGPFLRLKVTNIDRDVAHALPNGLLASQQGGSVAAREKGGQFIPDRAVYRVRLTSEEPVGDLANHSWRGKVVVAGEWDAPGLRFFRAALALLWREAGF